MNDDGGRSTDRRSFLRTACVGGLCVRAGGLSGEPIPGTRGSAADQAAPGDADGAANQAAPGLPEKWIGALLPMMAGLDPHEARPVLKEASAAHWEDLGMAATVERFRGDLPGFLDFLRSEWGWLVDHDIDAGVILVNENKSHCVCPLVPQDPGDDLGALCYCSEGFAERMFSAVMGASVRAQVTTSILRGGDRCRYRIDLTG